MDEPSPKPPGNTQRVLRNASFLLGAQVLVVPLAILVNAVAARTLGAAQFGLYFQALTFASFVFVFIEWGQSAVLTGRVATQRERAGELLGSGLAFRVVVALPVGALALGIVALVGYGDTFIWVFALAMLGLLFATVSRACQDVYRGYERTDFAAATLVGWQVLGAAVVVPVLLAGGGLFGMLFAQLACVASGAAFVLWMAPRMQVPRLKVRVDTMRELFRQGHPFLLFTLVLALQPMMEAAYLSWLGSAEEMGWYAAARKLTGVLIFPASALIAALYPTLCRLHAQDRDEFRQTAADALSLTLLAALPVALGCGLFPELGVAIFGLRDYAPAQDNLRLLACWVLLVYFSMPISSCLIAAGRQKAWTWVLLTGVAINVVLDPILILWFQERGGNGGLGLCLAAVICESAMLAGGLYLLPKGVLSRTPLKRVASALFAGTVMALTALATASLNTMLCASLAVLAYTVCLHLTGGLDLFRLRSVLDRLRGRTSDKAA